jgi:predicted nucleic acid-binding Zn ribbon protein
MVIKKQSSDVVHIGEVIAGVLTTCRGDCNGDLLQVWKLWDDAVGDTIAKNAKPEAFKGRLLLVRVNSSPWMHHLQFLKKDIIKKVNAALEKDLVQDIKFKIGPV